MPKRRTPASPWPASLDALFSDTDRRDACKREWRRLANRGGVKLAALPDILTRAWFCAHVERDLHTALNRSDFFERDRRIRKLVEDLFRELKQLATQDQLNPILRLRLARVWLDEDSPAPAPSTELEALAPPPDRLQTSVEPVLAVFSVFAQGLTALLDALGQRLRRAKGHQRQPWIAPAMRDLRKAGLTREEADNLLRSMGLKGSEVAEAARQTIPRR